jgi:hypothetical protein
LSDAGPVKILKNELRNHFYIRLPKGKTERDVKAFFEGRRHSHVRKPAKRKSKNLNAKNANHGQGSFSTRGRQLLNFLKMTKLLIEALIWGLCCGIVATAYRAVLAYEDYFTKWWQFGARYEGRWFFKPVWSPVRIAPGASWLCGLTSFKDFARPGSSDTA